LPLSDLALIIPVPHKPADKRFRCFVSAEVKT
jgi:hypothetical protein